MRIIQPLTDEEYWMQTRPAVQNATARFITSMLLRDEHALRILIDPAEFLNMLFFKKPPEEPEKP